MNEVNKFRLSGIILILSFPVSLVATNLILKSKGMSGEMFVSANFDGLNQQCFLDTGSNESELEFNEHFKAYRVLRKQESFGASGKIVADDIILFKKIRLDQHTVNDQEVAIYKAGERRHACRLGMNAFQNGRFLLDPRQERLQFGVAAPENLNKDVIELVVSRLGYIVFFSRLKANGTPLKTLFDTGAGITAINREYVLKNKKHFKFVRKLNEARDSTGRLIPVELYRLVRLQIGETSFAKEHIISMSFEMIHQHIDRDIQILLGYNFIVQKSWWIDIPAATMGISD